MHVGDTEDVARLARFLRATPDRARLTWFVALRGEVVVAAASLDDTLRQPRVDVRVHPSWAGRGIERSLIVLVARAAHERGARAIKLPRAAENRALAEIVHLLGPGRTLLGVPLPDGWPDDPEPHLASLLVRLDATFPPGLALALRRRLDAGTLALDAASMGHLQLVLDHLFAARALLAGTPVTRADELDENAALRALRALASSPLPRELRRVRLVFALSFEAAGPIVTAGTLLWHAQEAAALLALLPTLAAAP